MNKTQTFPNGSAVSIHSPTRPALSGRTGMVIDHFPKASSGPLHSVIIPSLDPAMPYYFTPNELTSAKPSATLEEPTEERNTMPVQEIPNGTTVVVNMPTTDVHGKTGTVAGSNTSATDRKGKRVGIYSVNLPGKDHPIYLHPDELTHTEPRSTVDPTVVMQAIENVINMRRKAQQELAEAQQEVDRLTEQVGVFNSIIAALSKL